MDFYTNQDTIPLSFMRVRNNAPITGLVVTVVVKNAASGATLLSSTTLPEVVAGSGNYTYNWNHGINSIIECVATYTTGSSVYVEYFTISNASQGRAS